MAVDERAFRAALSSVVKGAMLVALLFIVRAVAPKLPGVDTEIGRMTVAAYLRIAVSLVIIGVLVKIYAPLRELATFYLSTAIKVGQLPGREKYLPHVVALSASIILLIYVVVVYQLFAPVMNDLNSAYFHSKTLRTVIGLAAAAVGLFILVRIWMQAQPLVDLATGKITETAGDATVKVAHVACPKCGAQNDRDTKFCQQCGAPMAPPAPAAAFATAAATRACAQCGAQNAPAARFCGGCGAALA
jgi:hypothetical protein